jgi:hypothetical protein
MSGVEVKNGLSADALLVRASAGTKVWLATALIWRGSMQITGGRIRLSSVLNHVDVRSRGRSAPHPIDDRAAAGFAFG